MKNILVIDDDYMFWIKKYNDIIVGNDCQILDICSEEEKISNILKNERVDVVILGIDSIIENNKLVPIIELLKHFQKNKMIILVYSKLDYIPNVINSGLTIYKIIKKDFELLELKEIIDKMDFNSKNNLYVYDLLKEFIFNKGSMGYNYTIQVLNYCLNENIDNISNIAEIYKIISLKNGSKSYSHIKWNIDKAIKSMELLTPQNVIIKYFPYDEMPSTKVFFNEILHIYNKKYKK